MDKIRSNKAASILVIAGIYIVAALDKYAFSGCSADAAEECERNAYYKGAGAGYY